MKTKTKPRKRRLVYGRDWHGWAWRNIHGMRIIKHTDNHPGHVTNSLGGRWVRVKFVEVEDK